MLNSSHHFMGLTEITKKNKLNKLHLGCHPLIYLMQLSAYTLSVPTKTYIRKYFNCLYGDPILLSHKSDFGDTILTKLLTCPIIRVNKKELAIASKDYSEKIAFQVPIDMIHRLETELTHQQVYGINRYLENVFETDLCMFVACANFFGIERKVSIERFASMHKISIEEDVTYEALKQKEYRYRKNSTSKNLFLLQMSSPFSIFKRSA